MDRKFNTSQSYVRKISKENGVTYRKRKRVPGSNPNKNWGQSPGTLFTKLKLELSLN